jgi:aldehyde dehydrogenase (NAD+)
MVWQGNYSKLFIGGEWIEPVSTEWIEVVSPSTEDIIARVPAASRTDMDKAVDIARDAFDHGRWPRTSLDERMEVIRRLIAELDERRDLVATLISEEMGCPIQLSRSIQAGGAKLAAQAFLEMASQYPFSALRESSSGSALVTREPVGVVAAVIPWNVPLTIAILKLVPALLVGCTVVLKPAPETPLNAYLLAEMFESAGLPKGVLSVLPADRDVSEHLVAHRAVDKVTFTGSTAAGRRIAALCGQDLRRVTLELGGKSAAILLDDADLDATVESLRNDSLRNSGQVCSLKTRIVVPRAREVEFLERMAAMMSSMSVGDPLDPQTQIGPMVSARQRDRVESYIDIGRSEGAKVVIGGGRPESLHRGWYVEPTLFSGVDPSMRIAQEEIFGPVLAVLAYDDEDQAVAIANDSAYGLNGSVFTSDPEHGLAVARRMVTGTVELNGSPTGSRAPSGGFKSSGIGREKGPEGFDPYVEIKSIGLPDSLAEVLSRTAN